MREIVKAGVEDLFKNGTGSEKRERRGGGYDRSRKSKNKTGWGEKLLEDRMAEGLY